MTKSFLKSKTNDKYRGLFPFEFASKAKETQAIPETIHIIPIGQWDHDLYGPILITTQDCKEFIQNFNANIRKGVYITAGHEGFDELPAQGWITDLELRDTGVWGKVAWNELGKATLNDKQYKFFSPEFYRDYEDPQSHALYRNVLIGGALTKSPYFKELEAIVFSEPKFKKQFNDNQTTMNLAELLAKDISTLNDAEIAYIKEHKAELTDEQKTAYTSIIDVETPEEKEARETQEKELGDANEAAGLNRDGSAKDATAADPAAPAETKTEEATPAAPADTKVEASDKKILMSETELNALKVKAGKVDAMEKEAFAEKIKTEVSALTFSEGNKGGKFLPKSSDNLRTFMETLNDTQRVQFKTLVSQLPKTEIFSEAGIDAVVTDGTAKAELDLKVAAKQEANKKLSYSDALKEVFAENKDLEQRYNDELPASKSKMVAA